MNKLIIGKMFRKPTTMKEKIYGQIYKNLKYYANQINRDMSDTHFEFKYFNLKWCQTFKICLLHKKNTNKIIRKCKVT